MSVEQVQAALPGQSGHVGNISRSYIDSFQCDMDVSHIGLLASSDFLMMTEKLRRDYRNHLVREEDFLKPPNRDRVTVADIYFGTIAASKEPLSTLQRVYLNDLRIGLSAVDGYVIVRVLEHGIRRIGWSSVIEDEKGVTCVLNLFNFPPLEPLCVGAVLIIKEPYFKLCGDGRPLIRCDCPTDVIVLKRTHPLHQLGHEITWKNQLGDMTIPEKIVLYQPINTPADEWCLQGDTFLTTNPCFAIECYLLGQRACFDKAGPLWKGIQSKLCSTYFSIGYYEKTIETFESIPHHQNANFKACVAYYKLRRFREATTMLMSFVNTFPGDDDGRTWLRLADARLQEQLACEDIVERLECESSLYPLLTLDHADYTGPIIIVPIPGKGRGVVLTKDVSAKTILMVSKAFVSTLDPTKASEFHPGISSSFHFSGTDLQHIAEIAQAVARNPQTIGSMIYCLSDGSEDHPEVKLYCSSSNTDEPICDVKRIQKIYRINKTPIFGRIDGERKVVGVGLFIVPSFLNHCCMPNVTCEFYGDVMVVKSLGPLAAGTELCVSYIPTDWPYKKRLQYLNANRLTCNCQRCLFHI